MKRVGGCTVPLADWPLFHCTCRTGSSGGGGGGGGGGGCGDCYVLTMRA